jgi:AcrR family transcriptional regulator
MEQQAEPALQGPPIEKVELPSSPDPDPLRDPLSLAVVAEIAGRGYAATSIGDVARRAGVTRAAFEERFRDLDDCALDTLERLIIAFERRIGTAYNRHRDWRDALRAAAFEAADWLDAYPESATFVMTETLHMRDERARVHREALFDLGARLIEPGRDLAVDPQAVPPETSVMAAGSILQLLTHRLLEGSEVSFQEGARESLYRVVRMYLGEGAAREELTITRAARGAPDRPGPAPGRVVVPDRSAAASVAASG